MATKRNLTVVGPASASSRPAASQVDAKAVAGPTASTTAPARRSARRARPVRSGDIAPRLDAAGIESFSVSSAIKAATGAQVAAASDMVSAASRDGIGALAQTLRTIIAGASPDEAAALRKALLESGPPAPDRIGSNPDEELSDDWRDGGYPYKNLMLRRNYERRSTACRWNCSSCRPGSRRPVSAW